MARKNAHTAVGYAKQSESIPSEPPLSGSNSPTSQERGNPIIDRGPEIVGNRRTSKKRSSIALDQRAVRSVDVGVPSKSGGNEGSRIPETDCWLSTEEVSRRLKIPEKTLANWASLGKGPRYARMGRYRRYRFSDLIIWEEAQLERGGGA